MPGKSLAQLAAEAERVPPPIRRGGNAKPVYSKLFDRKAFDYALLGATNAQIGELIGVAETTIDAWMVEKPTFARAVRRARIDANVRVVKSLYAAATGYSHRETKLNVIGGKLKKTDVTKHYPPSVNAAALVLANRDPTRWKDKRTVEHEGTINLAALVDSSFGDLAKPVEATLIEPEEEE